MLSLRNAAPFVLLYGIYFLIALVITYPLIMQIDTRLIGHPFGDAYEYVGLSWWIKTALQSGRDPFFQPLLLYPDGLPAPLLWSIPLQSFPTWLLAFFLPLTTAFNLSALLTLALNGLAMFGLVRVLVRPHPPTPSPWGEGEQKKIADGKNAVPTARWAADGAAFVAGVIWLAYPTFQGQLGAAHTGLLALWGAPLLVLALLKLRETERPVRWIITAAILFPVSLWGNLTLIVYLIAPLCGLMVVWGIWHDLTPQPPLHGERGEKNGRHIWRPYDRVVG